MFEHQSDDSDVTWCRGRGPRLRAVARALLVLLARGHEQDLFLTPSYCFRYFKKASGHVPDFRTNLIINNKYL